MLPDCPISLGLPMSSFGVCPSLRLPVTLRNSYLGLALKPQSAMMSSSVLGTTSQLGA